MTAAHKSTRETLTSFEAEVASSLHATELAKQVQAALWTTSVGRPC